MHNRTDPLLEHGRCVHFRRCRRSRDRIEATHSPRYPSADRLAPNVWTPGQRPRRDAGPTVAPCASGRPRSWRSAEAGSRSSGATLCSTTTCARSPASRDRGSASCRPRAVTPTITSSGSIGRFRPRVCEPSHISLFRRETGVGDPRAHLLAQDLIYVGGGSVVSLLGTWRAHGIDCALREAWEAGVVLCGGSAGSLCWFTHAVSGFHEGPARQHRRARVPPVEQRRPLRRGGGAADGVPCRRSRTASVPATAPATAAALHFVGKELSEVVSSRARARARMFVSCGRRRVGTLSSASWRSGTSAAEVRGAPRRSPRERPGGTWCADGDAPARSSRWAAAASRWSASPALDQLRARADRQAGPEGLLPADRQRRPARPGRRASTSASAAWPCEPSILSLFHLGRDRIDPIAHLLAQDAIYVGGGSMRNMLAIWREHGIDDAMRDGVGARHRARRAERRRDVLVRGRGQHERRRAGGGRAGSGCSPAACRSISTASIERLPALPRGGRVGRAAGRVRGR